MAASFRWVLQLHKDVPKAARFYSEGLDFSVNVCTQRWAELQSGPLKLALMHSSSSGRIKFIGVVDSDAKQLTQAPLGASDIKLDIGVQKGYSSLLSFTVDDINNSVTKLLALGAELDGPIKYEIHGKKGNNNNKRKHGEQRSAMIDARRRNRASIAGQTYDSSGTGGGDYNSNGTNGGGAAHVAGVAAMSATLTSIAIGGDDGGGDGGGGDGDGGGGRVFWSAQFIQEGLRVIGEVVGGLKRARRHSGVTGARRSSPAPAVDMGSIPVFVKHSGRWTYGKIFEEYVTDAILLSTSTTFIELHDVLASHLSVDLTSKRILVEYQITGNAGQIEIHNDMSLKVFIFQKKLIQDMNCLLLYVSILEKVVGSNVVSSSICVAERITNSDNLQTVINTINEGALVVSEDTQALDVFEMDTVKVIISDPHHKHVEEDQALDLLSLIISHLDRIDRQRKYGKRENMCVVSDRNANIIKAVGDVYKDVPHYGYCTSQRICVYGTRHRKALYYLPQGKKCSCNAFQLDEIPCAHACAVLERKNFEKGPYCCDLFKSKNILKTYDASFYPLPHKDDWIILESILGEIVLPPKFKRPPERPAKKDREKSGRDTFGKKNINSCGGCGAKGHNRRSCRKYRK
ncbi:putative beta-adaptin-like protein C [Capsicum annuum]|nr:putative beta-adaptin-like protein C [Capsicum annuum]